MSAARARRPPRPRPLGDGCRRALAALGAVAVVATACTPAGGEEATGEPPIRVAVSADPEGTFLGHLLSAVLVAAEVETELVAFADARDGRQALELGDVDVRAGYTGETWLETLGRADPPGDPEASFGPVRAQDARRGVTWLEPRFSGSPDGPPANATFAFAVAGPPGIDADLRTISQLAARLEEQPEASVCVDPEFGEREDGLRAVLDAYRVRSDRRFLATAPDEAVRAVATGGCIAGLTTATDGASWAAGLQPLEDDLEVFPAFVVAPQVRESVLEDRPELAVALAPLAELTSPSLAAWSGQVLGGASVEEVAAEAALELRDRADATS